MLEGKFGEDPLVLLITNIASMFLGPILKAGH